MGAGRKKGGLGFRGFGFGGFGLRVYPKSGPLLATILHFCYNKTQQGLKMIIFNIAPTGNQKP